MNLVEARDWKLEGSDLPPRVCRLDEATRMWTLSDKQQVQIRILVSTLQTSDWIVEMLKELFAIGFGCDVMRRAS